MPLLFSMVALGYKMFSKARVFPTPGSTEEMAETLGLRTHQRGCSGISPQISGPFRGAVGRTMSLEYAFERYFFFIVFSVFFFFFSLFLAGTGKWKASYATCPWSHDVLIFHTLKAIDPSDHGVKFPHLEVKSFLLECFVTIMKNLSNLLLEIVARQEKWKSIQMTKERINVFSQWDLILNVKGVFPNPVGFDNSVKL